MPVYFEIKILKTKQSKNLQIDKIQYVGSGANSLGGASIR